MTSSVLRPEVVSWIEASTSLRVQNVTQIPAGGRLGYFVDVTDGTTTTNLFLQVGRGLSDGPNTFQGFAVEADVYRALGAIGVPVPKVWGFDEKHDLLLVDRADGAVWFHPPAEQAEQVSVAQDFIRHLARWHSVPASELGLQCFGPVKSWREHQLEQLDANEAFVNASAGGKRLDPLVAQSLDWLRAHVPDADGPVVLVQGDTGPGNFIYDNGKVVAVIDWELAHFGDPMDDIAWLSWRATQHGFTDFPARLREYEQLCGVAVDETRVRYYRLNAFGRLGAFFGLASMGGRVAGLDTGEPAAVNRAADGSALILSTLHRRMRLDATSDALGLPKASRVLDEAPEPDHAPMFDSVLDQLRDMAPRIEDRVAKNSAKAVARQLKYLKELDRNGTLFKEQELDDLGRLLGSPVSDLNEARGLLIDGVYDDKVTFEDYLDYHWRRLRRDDHLMRHASGALYERGWPELV